MSLVTRVATHLALIAGGIAAALLIIEVGLRVANHWFPYFFRYDAERGWALRPDASGYYDREGNAWVRINAEGFRGPDRPLEKPPGTFRIALLGDSYTEAIQVPYEQTWGAVLERRLAGCPALRGRRVEVLNFGVDGYGTTQELITLRKQAIAYSPDVVVLAFFAGNDIRNNSVTLEGDQCRPFVSVGANGGLVPSGPLLNSRLFRLWCMTRFNSRDGSIPELFENAWRILRSGEQTPTAEHPEEVALNYSIYHPPPDAAWKDAWRVTDALIGATGEEAQRDHARLLVVTLDTGIQVWPDPKVRASFTRRERISDLFYPDEQIAADCRRRGIDVLTLAPELQRYAESNHVFLHGFGNTPMGFGHWNAIGHRVAGELIAAKLCTMLRGGGDSRQAMAAACDRCGEPSRPGVARAPSHDGR